MRSRSSRVLLAVGAVLAIAVAGAGAMMYVVTNPDKSTAAAVVTVVVLLAGTLLAAVNRILEWSGRKRGSSDDALGDVLDALAGLMDGQWSDEAAKRQITQPIPIKVAWTRPKDVPVSPIDSVMRSERESFGPRRLASADEHAAEQLLHGGVLDDILTLYSSLPRGRLAIIGRPGAGKTALLIWLLLSVLRERRAMTPDERAITPVPVLIPLTGWNPERKELADWVLDFMERQVLGKSRYRGRAGELLEQGLIALFLDGLDEMPVDRRAAALRAVAGMARTRVVLTSREVEYRTSVRQRLFPSAAVIRVAPVSGADGVDYLASASGDEAEAEIASLIERLTAPPPYSVLPDVFSTPLALNLALSAYAGGAHDSAELIAVDDSDDPPDERTRLAWRRLWKVTADDAYADLDGAAARQRVETLAWIASRMEAQGEGTRDLLWWHVRQWLLPWAGPFASALVFGLTVLGVVSLVGGVRAGIATGTAWFAADAIIGGVAAVIGANRRVVLVRSTLPRIVAGVSLGVCVVNVAVLKMFIEGDVRSIVTLAGFATLGGVCQGMAAAAVALIDKPLLGALRRPGRADVVTGGAAGVVTGLVLAVLLSPGVAVALAAIAFLGMTTCMALARPAVRPAERMTPSKSVREDLVGAAMFCAVGGTLVLVAVALSLLASSMSVGRLLLVSTLTAVGGAASAMILLSQCVAFALTCGSLWLVRQSPLRLLCMLDDAWNRQMLRRNGAIYQFRHGELQAYLASVSAGHADERSSSRAASE